MAAPGYTKPDIILNSPVGNKPAIYKWPLTYVSKGQKIDGGEEIIETIRWVGREFMEFKAAIENLLHDQLDYKNYDFIKTLCDKYNKIIDITIRMNKGTSVAIKTPLRASQDLLKHIIQQVYNYAVADPTELNKYSPFSSETYGETSFEFMAQLIGDEFKPGEQDTFIDLGSGVGHLVLQMAASIKCKKCYGIEIADVPASYAKRMEERFKFWMKWHGKTYTEFELFHGDFFDRKYADLIKNSNYILVNNFAFKPEVDYKLKERFLDLKDGTRILSSKPFCSTKNRLTERYLSDIGSIMHVVPIQPQLSKDTVSWTPKPLPYYLHVLDGSKLEKYYERRQKRKQDGSQSDKGRSNKRSRTSKGGSDSYSDDSDDNTVYGPTTRKAWSEWCNASSMNTSNRTSTDSGKTVSSRNNSTDTETLSDGAINDDNNLLSKVKEPQAAKKEKKSDTKHAVPNDRSSAISQESSAQQTTKNNSTPKSCLDKKRDYAVKSNTSSSSNSSTSSSSSSNSSSSSSTSSNSSRESGGGVGSTVIGESGSSLLQNAPPSALYSISKPVDNSSSSTLKIPNIVIKVKPPIEAKMAGDSMSSIVTSRAATVTVATVPKPPVKLQDENGKKLRQRKKAAPAPDQNESSAAPSSATKTNSKSESKATIVASSSSVLGTTTNGTRSKNKQPATAKVTSGKVQNIKKKPTSPEKNQSLDLLHAKTVESVLGNTGNYSNPAPGCEDHNLRSIIDTPSLPKVVIKDLSMYISAILGPKNIEKFIECTKQEFESFTRKIQQPNTKETLLKSIELERMRNRELHRAEDELTRHIKCLNERIPKATKIHCDELGIKNNHRSLVGHFGALLKKHQDLTTYLLQAEQAVNQRTMIPPAAHSNSSQSLTSPFRAAASSATLDLSLKQTTS